MKLSLSFMLFIFLCSCDKVDYEVGSNIDISASVFLVNDSGQDLLNPKHPDGIHFAEIKVYEVVDGKKVEIQNLNSDAPKGISLIEPEGDIEKYRLNLTFNITENSNMTETIIQWEEGDEDNLKAKLKRGDNFITCEEVWVNGEKVWDLYDDGGERSFVLVK